MKPRTKSPCFTTAPVRVASATGSATKHGRAGPARRFAGSTSPAGRAAARARDRPTPGVDRTARPWTSDAASAPSWMPISCYWNRIPWLKPLAWLIGRPWNRPWLARLYHWASTVGCARVDVCHEVKCREQRESARTPNAEILGRFAAMPRSDRRTGVHRRTGVLRASRPDSIAAISVAPLRAFSTVSTNARVSSVCPGGIVVCPADPNSN